MTNAYILTNAIILLCLLNSMNGLAAPQNNKDHKYTAACRAVAEAANHGKLNELAISPSNFNKLDINNDGKLERVVVTSEGTMHIEGLEVFDADGKPIVFTHSDADDWESDNLRWAMDQMIIKHDGQIYILGKTDDNLHYLSRVDNNNVEKVVCQFAQRKEPIETLVMSRNDNLCQAAMKRELNYVAYDRAHALTHANVQASGFHETSPGKLAALIDINNDGEIEPVVQLQLASGRGRGCGANYLGVLNTPRNKLNMEMTKSLPEPACDGVVQTPFVFERQTYIEKLGAPSNIHQIMQLTQNKLEIVCQFDVRKVNYMLGEYERILANAKSAHVDPWVFALEMPGISGLQTMIDAKHDLRLKVRSNVFGTVIHEAIRRKKYDGLQFLLENGADPNVTANDKPNDPDNQPPLIFAIWVNSIESVRMLLKHGANPNQRWAGQTAKDWVNFWVHSETDKALMLGLLSKK